MMAAVCPRCAYVGQVSLDGEWIDHTEQECVRRRKTLDNAATFTVKCSCYFHGVDGKCGPRGSEEKKP